MLEINTSHRTQQPNCHGYWQSSDHQNTSTCKYVEQLLYFITYAELVICQSEAVMFHESRGIWGSDMLCWFLLYAIFCWLVVVSMSLRGGVHSSLYEKGSIFSCEWWGLLLVISTYWACLVLMFGWCGLFYHTQPLALPPMMCSVVPPSVWLWFLISTWFVQLRWLYS